MICDILEDIKNKSQSELSTSLKFKAEAVLQNKLVIKLRFIYKGYWVNISAKIPL